MHKFYLPLICLVVGFGFGWSYDALICRIPKESTTQTAIIAVEKTVCNYYSKNKRVPKTISELPDADKAGFAIDGWRQPLKYKVDAGTIVTISADIPTFCGSGIVHTFTRTFDCAKRPED